jgi:hypothetical protein
VINVIYDSRSSGLGPPEYGTGANRSVQPVLHIYVRFLR